MNHKWSEKTRAPNGDSRKVCTREGCEIVCVSRHRIEPNGRQDHYKEWFRGSARIQIGGNTPACEAVEVRAGTAAAAVQPTLARGGSDVG
ncbi:hypothetical protein ABIF65_003339 [Bradyrhizobium japonicum]|jgi:hypothetical protein|uniref:Cytochrome C n=1 Tax=Bradyrhizobium barranii subsp. barranii TaxID=2823807 RepID=A0A7Z0TV73_9BRAD|nr:MULTISPECIES: hypothetical protein [Bradyrhizobium]MBR0882364.1 cytochrome C [Bradyrhizobium liaoningense]MBR0947393.1 cytochrome C [Bradyrhizobium liaoningense]MBR1004042.1 cytochrome C [Bradyrhizobium liaoningense]MBR1068701.1 cytochrome C [Bradyrhizobium liaoningense]MCP1741341.1 hypothetical protein [Bradyrhizobium japonicum]